MGAYEQELYRRHPNEGDVAKQTETPCCTDHWYVNTEAISIESGASYPGRSAGILSKACANASGRNNHQNKNGELVPAEVSRGHSTAISRKG